jgi:hypothetical protein
MPHDSITNLAWVLGSYILGATIAALIFLGTGSTQTECPQPITCTPQRFSFCIHNPKSATPEAPGGYSVCSIVSGRTPDGRMTFTATTGEVLTIAPLDGVIIEETGKKPEPYKPAESSK